ncbi:MAG TPA: carbohydrate ABC transporter permease [Anaerolineaceae bacterium]|nr:carbohydrate ABC transporter permease [Anaerolineaceae bacterium]
MNLGKKVRERIFKGVALFFLICGFLVVITPLLWMMSSALKSKDAVSTFPPQLVPQEQYTVNVNGIDAYMYDIPVDGQMRQLALTDKTAGLGTFVNPENPEEQYQLKVADGKRSTQVILHFENFYLAMTKVPFGRYLINTLTIVIFATFGTLVSCTLVAYGFSRFRARGLKTLFLVLLSTVMLPPQVTLIPTFIIFKQIGWYDTLLPLIVPAFFANAWDVFLLRQFFLSLPLELDDAARIDGCGPLGILWHIIIPQSYPVLMTVTIFTVLYAWNDFYAPLIYLQSPENWTVALGLQSFNALYTNQGNLLMAASLVLLIPPILIFFFAQKLFIQGVVVSGIKG